MEVGKLSCVFLLVGTLRPSNFLKRVWSQGEFCQILSAKLPPEI